MQLLNISRAKQLIERCCPDIQVKTINPITEGWVFHIFDVNDEFIFRFPRRSDGTEQLEIETKLLPILAKEIPISIPLFEYTCEGTDDKASDFVGYRKIHGVPLSKEDIQAGDSLEIARQLAHILTKLHAFPLEQVHEIQVPNLSAAKWHQEYQNLYSQLQGFSYKP